jgi:hypothetical protein
LLSHFSGVDQQHDIRRKATQLAGPIFWRVAGVHNEDHFQVPDESGFHQLARYQYTGRVIRTE